MGQTINEAKTKIVFEYLTRINNVVEEYNGGLSLDDDIFDLLYEIINVFEEDIPQLKSSVLFRTGTELRDINTVKALLKMYLANSGIEYKEEQKEENTGLKRFWSSFILWFENELINTKLLQSQYVR